MHDEYFAQTKWNHALASAEKDSRYLATHITQENIRKEKRQMMSGPMERRDKLVAFFL